MAHTILEVIQLRRTLWLVIQQVGKPVVLDESQCHPLWRMNATRMPDGKMQLEALQLPDPTEEQLAELAETLNGTMTELGDAMQPTALKDHPPAYLEKCLKSRVVRQADGYWVDVALEKIIGEKPAGEN
ncbi:MAG: hypothetical protein U1E51_26295 [Candidatus Binatia bacterium]|nr:hypothetical protein [Candidatus Binatia bacterium]